MTRTVALPAALCLALATLFAGWLHGQATNRWGAPPDIQAIANKLERVHDKDVGNWRLQREEELDPSVRQMLQCEGKLLRVYQHRETGDVISVVVLLGPSGPIAVHTPEICYSSRDYSIGQRRKSIDLKDVADRQHSLWDLELKPRRSESPALRVLYAWSPGDAWQATASPRFAFAGAPYLYKLQIAGPTISNSTDSEFDPCQDFLQSFLAALSSHLTAPGRST
jgi:hypothetical protein